MVIYPWLKIFLKVEMINLKKQAVNGLNVMVIISLNFLVLAKNGEAVDSHI